MEEHIVSGGLGSIVLEVLNKFNYKNYEELIRLGIDNKFINKYGSQEDLLAYSNLSAKKIYEIIKKKL